MVSALASTQQSNMMKAMRSIIVFIIMLIAGVSFADNVKGNKVFTKFAVKTYTAPTFDSPQVDQLSPGVSLDVISVETDWLKVKTQNGSEGWVAKSWITDNKDESVKIQQQERQRTTDRINELETKAKSIPDSEIYDKRNIYRELVKLVPGNADYKMRLKSCEKEISKTSNFRKARWGMTKEDVQKLEGSNPKYKDYDVLVYPSRLDGKAVDLVYIFAGNSLVRAKYILTENHTNKNDFIGDYTALKDLLIKKYGRPHIDDKIWKNSLFKDDNENEGVAIGSGGLVYLATWKTTPTDIGIILTGDNYRIDCTIEYIANEFRGVENKANETKALNDL